MIQGFYIISEDGACYYEYKNDNAPNGGKNFDASLITGFVSALYTFSSEAFSETLQTINLKRNLLVISSHKTEYGLIVGAAIADYHDNPYLVQRISLQLLHTFEKEFEYIFGSMSFDQKLIFDHIVRSRIHNFVRNRDYKSILIGSLGTLPVYAMASYLYYNPYSPIIGLLAFPIGLALSSLCSFYIGSMKTSTITLTLLILALNQPMRFYLNDLSLIGLANFVEFPEIFLVISLTLGFIGGISGGWIADRMYLYQSGYTEPYSQLLHFLKSIYPK